MSDFHTFLADSLLNKWPSSVAIELFFVFGFGRCTTPLDHDGHATPHHSEKLSPCSDLLSRSRLINHHSNLCERASPTPAQSSGCVYYGSRVETVRVEDGRLPSSLLSSFFFLLPSFLHFLFPFFFLLPFFFVLASSLFPLSKMTKNRMEGKRKARAAKKHEMNHSRKPHPKRPVLPRFPSIAL